MPSRKINIDSSSREQNTLIAVRNTCSTGSIGRMHSFGNCFVRCRMHDKLPHLSELIFQSHIGYCHGLGQSMLNSPEVILRSNIGWCQGNPGRRML
jgi:hypothetical protein